MSFLRVTALSLLSTFIVTLYLYPNLRSFSAISSALKLFFTSRYISTASSHQFGLKISLILASFYGAQGLTGLLSGLGNKTTTRKQAISLPLLTRIPFHFMEIPILLGFIVFGSVLIPVGAVDNYTRFLAGFAPAVPILEVICLMTVVMAAGRSWTPKIVESHDLIKILVILSCFASFFISSSAIYLIYAHFNLSTLVSSLLSSIFTIILIQILTCCQLDHSTITDPALIFPYISYSLSLITLKSGMKAILDHQRDPQIYPKNPQTFLKFADILLSTSPNPSLTRQILQTIFSPVLIFHLLLQLALVTVEIENSTSTDEPEDSDESFFNKILNYFVSNIWPLFGKSFLVIIYTISWLDSCHPETFPSNSILHTSRWISIAFSLAWYGKHLIFDKYPKDSYTCDKSFWKQFHGLKD